MGFKQNSGKNTLKKIAPNMVLKASSQPRH